MKRGTHVRAREYKKKTVSCKRSQAEVIATVVLVLIAISVMVIIYSYVKNTTLEKTSNIEERITAISNINLNIAQTYFVANDLYISVENTGSQDITSFAVKITSEEKKIYVNNSVYLKNKEKLGPLNKRDIIIIPAPFGNISSNYSLIEIYPKFEFKGKEEIADTGKASASGGGGGGGGSGSGNTCTPSAEVCDGIDNNCNGIVDEGCLCDGSSMTVCKQYSGNKSTGADTNCLSNSCSVYEKWCNGADINQDGVVNDTDINEWNSRIGYSGCNYTSWATSYGAGSDWCNGADINQDGAVDGGDYSLWQNNLNRAGCNLPQNISIDCYSNKTCSDQADYNSCTSLTGCNWTQNQCIDNDNDGYGAVGSNFAQCKKQGVDCNDNNSSINPGASEICDGIDNNCNGIVDESCYSPCNSDSDCPNKNCYISSCSSGKCSFTFTSAPGCTSCETNITQENSIFTLNNDLLNCDHYGIMIKAKNVTVDCNFHEISGSNATSNFPPGDCNTFFSKQIGPSGVITCLGGMSTNYNIKNCVIHDFPYIGWYGGCIASYSGDFPIEYAGSIENNLFSNCAEGIMQWSDFDTIKNNKFYNASILLDEASANKLENNIMVYSGLKDYCGSGPACGFKDYHTVFLNNIFTNSGIDFEPDTGAYILADLINNTFTSPISPISCRGSFASCSIVGTNLSLQGNILNGQPYP